MAYFSQFYKVEVRDSIVREFTDSEGKTDDMMAGLHEIRLRNAEKKYDLAELQRLAGTPRQGERVTSHG